MHLVDPAVAVLRGIERSDDSPWVFRGQKPGAHLGFLHGPWYRILMRSGIESLRIHDLRHSFASGGLLVGEDLLTIGKLLGHNKVQTTAREAHIANDPVKSAANRIASRIGEVAGLTGIGQSRLPFFTRMRCLAHAAAHGCAAARTERRPNSPIAGRDRRSRPGLCKKRRLRHFIANVSWPALIVPGPKTGNRRKFWTESHQGPAIWSGIAAKP